MDTLPDIFRSMVQEVLEKDPQGTADYVLKLRGIDWSLVIPKQDSSGFEITVTANSAEVSVFTECGAHRHFTSDGNHKETSANALGFARDLLSETMRVRVFEIRGGPYRFDFEWYRDGRWQTDGSTMLFVIPWFGKKTEKLYSNRRMPPRNY